MSRDFSLVEHHLGRSIALCVTRKRHSPFSRSAGGWNDEAIALVAAGAIELERDNFTEAVSMLTRGRDTLQRAGLVKFEAFASAYRRMVAPCRGTFGQRAPTSIPRTSPLRSRRIQSAACAH